MAYKLLGNHTAPGLEGKPIEFILRKADGAWIPKVTDNTDYQEYLEWVAAGNTPEAAD
jgi:hypothetical protein